MFFVLFMFVNLFEIDLFLPLDLLVPFFEFLLLGNDHF